MEGPKEQVVDARMKKDREEAEKFMDSIGEQEAPDNPAPGAADSQTAEVVSPVIPDETVTPPAPVDSQELVRLQNEVSQLRAQLENEDSQTHRSQALLFKSQRDTAREEIRELKEQLKAVPQAAPTPPSRMEDDPEYLADMEEVGERQAKFNYQTNKALAAKDAETARLVEEKTRPVADKLESVTKDQAVTAEERFFNGLAARVPDWKKYQGGNGQQQDPLFTKFLTEPVPFQDYSYNDLLMHHYGKGNVPKVAEIFESFKKTVAPAQVPEPPKPNPLEQHLEPTKTNRGTETPADNAKPTYSRKEIEEFDKKKRAGLLFGMSKEEIQAKSKLYQAAIFDGRVK